LVVVTVCEVVEAVVVLVVSDVVTVRVVFVLVVVVVVIFTFWMLVTTTATPRLASSWLTLVARAPELLEIDSWSTPEVAETRRS